jgi:3-methyladenine DNA glycosylase AlkD
MIKRNDFEDTLKISKMLLNDNEDLIHKAVGWMLREVGKRNLDIEKQFLDKYHTQMPRVMVRYAIERFEQNLRKQFLIKKGD